METRIAELRKQKEEFESAWRERARQDALQDIECIGYTDFLYIHDLQREIRELWDSTPYHEEIHETLLGRLDHLQDRLQEWKEEGRDCPCGLYLDAWLQAVAGFYAEHLAGIL